MSTSGSQSARPAGPTGITGRLGTGASAVQSARAQVNHYSPPQREGACCLPPLCANSRRSPPTLPLSSLVALLPNAPSFYPEAVIGALTENTKLKRFHTDLGASSARRPSGGSGSGQVAGGTRVAALRAKAAAGDSLLTSGDEPSPPQLLAAARESRLKRFVSTDATGPGGRSPRNPSQLASTSWKGSALPADGGDEQPTSAFDAQALYRSHPAAQRLAGPENDGEQELILRLVQQFGDKAIDKVLELLLAQQTEMCNDLLKELEERLERLINTASQHENLGEADPISLARAQASMVAAAKKAVHSTQVRSVRRRAFPIWCFAVKLRDMCSHAKPARVCLENTTSQQHHYTKHPNIKTSTA